MKKIITGVRYNTSNAVAIGRHINGEYVTDFSYWDATLYVTKRSKRFFLAGSGGAMTQFSQSFGNDTIGGERIIPLSKAAALIWAEQYLDANVIEEHFSDSIQDA